jgi:transcriptional regulator with XRE-family HTH domain
MKQSNNPNDEATLRVLRESSQLTQEELSRKLGLSTRVISSWETGKKIPRFDNAVALASELRVSLKTLAKAFGLDVSNIPND